MASQRITVTVEVFPVAEEGVKNTHVSTTSTDSTHDKNGITTNTSEATNGYYASITEALDAVETFITKTKKENKGA